MMSSKDEAMNNTIAVVMRLTFVAMILLGFCLFGLLGLLSIVRELISNDHHLPPALSDSDSRTSEAVAPRASIQLERR
jgi:TRAP-type mannitol/chloroaromatic compound transport system permease small subunit